MRQYQYTATRGSALYLTHAVCNKKCLQVRFQVILAHIQSNANDVCTHLSTEVVSLCTVAEECKDASSSPDRVLVIVVVRTLLLVQDSTLQVVDSIDSCLLPVYIAHT
jgi:hypothetical protein